MHKYKYLLLDADGTFLDFARTEKLALEKLFQHYSIECSGDMLCLYHNANRQCWEDLEKGLISVSELETLRFERFFSAIRRPVSAQEASGRYITLLASNAFYLEGAERFLEEAGKEYRLAVITNGISIVQTERLRALNALRFFSHVIISQDIGISKLAKGFFDRTLEIIGASASECLIIGDSLTSDIAGGIGSGIDTLWYHPAAACPDSNMPATYSAGSYDEILSILKSL